MLTVQRASMPNRVVATPRSLAQGARLWALRKLLTAEPTIPSFAAAESWREEFIALRPQSSEDHRLRDLPLMVLTRGLKTDDRHKEVAAGFAALSRAGKLVIAEHSEHEIHMYQPELVIQSLRDIVEEVRKKTAKRG